MTIEAGLRQERSKTTAKGDVTVENPLNFMKPRVALTWIASANDQVRLRIEREVGQLNFEDFVASSNVASTGTLSAGNPDLTPQQAWVVEATYERRFKGAGALVVSGGSGSGSALARTNASHQVVSGNSNIVGGDNSATADNSIKVRAVSGTLHRVR